MFVGAWLLLILDAGLASLPNVALVIAMDLVWEAMWLWCRSLTAELRISALRMFFMMHVILVQVGLVTIHIFAQDPEQLARLYLDFRVEPSVSTVIFPCVFMALLLAGAHAFRGARRGVVPDGPPEPVGPLVLRRVSIVFVATFIWGAAAFARVGFPFLSSLSGGSAAEDSRLAYHYGERTSVLFNSSIVAQTYVAIIPFVAFVVWTSSKSLSRWRFAAYAMGLALLFLLANSLERTTPAILAIWFILAGLALGKRPNKRVLLAGPAVFIAVTLILHGSGASLMRVLELQVLRRVFVVNAMINYFAFERFGADVPLEQGSTYSGYLVAVSQGGGGFARELMTIIYPDRIIGTAPLGLIAEAWVNFGFLSLLAAPLIGILMLSVDHALARRNNSSLGSVLWAGVATLTGTMSYGAPLAVIFSGGLMFLVATYFFCDRRPMMAALRRRPTVIVQ